MTHNQDDRTLADAVEEALDDPDLLGETCVFIESERFIEWGGREHLERVLGCKVRVYRSRDRGSI